MLSGRSVWQAHASCGQWPTPASSTESEPVSDTSGPNIAVIGGGTGSFTLLQALKNYTSTLNAVVNMSDDGGSTGTLRDEYGVLPPGDIRQCLVALSQFKQARDLFNYRFDSGTLDGHAFGNLFLTAAEKMTGSFTDGIALAETLLATSGHVIPITCQNVTLSAHTSDGTVINGEYNVATRDFHGERPTLTLTPTARINKAAAAAIADADLVVIAPGHLYGSLAPALIVNGVAGALARTSAPVVFVCNLVTKPGQTDQFCVTDFADEIERFIGAPALDYVLYNTRLPDDDLLAAYAAAGEHAVAVTGETAERHWTPVGTPLLADTLATPASGDALAASRSLIRHDPDRTARALMRLYFS